MKYVRLLKRRDHQSFASEFEGFEPKPPDSTREELWKQKREYDFNRRLQVVLDKLQGLYAIRWELSILFEQDIDLYIQQYNLKFNELQTAMMNVYYKDADNDDRKLIYKVSNNDFFQNEINENTDKLLEFVRKHIR